MTAPRKPSPGRHLLAALLAMAVLAPSARADFSFDEMNQLDRTEQDELLARAKQEARSWNFGAAESDLEQAEQKDYAPDKIKAVRDLIAKERAAKAEKERREEERRRKEEEQRRLAEVRRNRAMQGGGSSSGGTVDWVNVTVEMTCGFFGGCLTRDLSVSGGPGNITDNGKWVSITNLGRGIAGVYHFSASFDGNRYCSGSFRVSGTKRNYAIRVYDDCSDASSGEY